MPAWPSSLPGMNSEGFLEEDQDNILRTTVDAGPELRRRRFTAVPTRIKGTLQLDSTEVATLLAFYRDTLSDGVLDFDWEHPRTEAAAVMSFRRFPKITGGPFNYTVALELEIKP